MLGVSSFLSTAVVIGPAAFIQKEFMMIFGINGPIIWTLMGSGRGVLSMIVSPLVGALSDRVGRVPVLAMKCFLGVLPYVPLAMNPNSLTAVLWALTFMMILGLSGNQFSLIFAYCADMCAKDRAHGQSSSLNATIASVLAVGFTPAMILGPPIAAVVSTLFGRDNMFKLLIGFGLANTLFTVFCLPESLPRRAVDPGSPVNDADTPTGRPPDVKRCNTLNPLRYFRLLSARGPAGPEVAKLLRRVCGVLFFLYTAKMSLIGIAIMYAELHFKWSAEKASLLIMTWGFVQCLSMHGLAFLDKRCFSKTAEMKASFERVVAWVGLWCGLIGMVFCAGAVVEWPLLAGMGIGAVSMVTYTALTAYAGRLVPPSMIGEVQGLLGTTLDLTEIVGPPVFGLLLRWTLSSPVMSVVWPSCIFVLGVILVVISMVLLAGLPPADVALFLSEQAQETRAELIEE